MKQLMRLTSLLVLLLVGVGFAACSEDEDKTPVGNGIVGTWRTDFVEDGEAGYIVVTFNSNGTGAFKIVEGSYGESSNFTYTYAKGVLTMRFSGEEPEISQVTVSGDKMMWDDEEFRRVR